MKAFQMKGAIITGKDALDALRQMPGGKTLVITDPFWSGNRSLARICSMLPGEYRVFDGVTGEPTMEMVAKGAAMLRQFGPDGMVALGGGSVMDAAKGIRKFGLREGEEIPLWAIPTTAGTGSEVTSYAVITDKGVKLPLVEDSLIPQRAILWGGGLDTLPGGAVADTGMDALSHCVEAYVSVGSDPYSNAFAREGVGIIWHNLPLAVEKGSSAPREKLLHASCMAGLAFNSSGLGICHSLSHALGGVFHLPHGRLNGVLLPAVMGWNLTQPEAAERYGELARLCGLSLGGGKTAAWSMVRGVKRLRDRLGMPQRLTQTGIERQALLNALPELCRAAMEDPCTATNPRPVTQQALEGILREVL